jgi:hypothetical protein
MKKISMFTLGFFLSINLAVSAQTVAEYISFDNYISPANNDLQNHFYSSGFGMSLTAIPSNGITGGCLLAGDTNIWGNDNATYCSKFKGVIGSGYGIGISFKYDTSSIHTSHFERPVSIWLFPSADWNHYLTTTISRTKKFEQLTYGWVNPTSPTLQLLHNHWYKFNLFMVFTGGSSGDQIDITSSVYNLGLNGTDPQVLIGSLSGTFNDSILIADTAISVSINGAHWGGAAYLDDFRFEGVKSSDSCLTPVGVKPIENSDFTYFVDNNMLHVKCKDDYRNTEVIIYNVNGQKILEYKLMYQEGECNLSQLPGGIFFLQIITRRKTYATKFSRIQ